MVLTEDRNENSFASEAGNNSIEDLIKALEHFTGFNWTMEVDYKYVLIKCNGEFVCKDTPIKVEKYLINLSNLMVDIYNNRGGNDARND